MTARLQTEKEELNAANEIVMQRVEKLSSENGDLAINNAALKVQQLARVNHYCKRYKKTKTSSLSDSYFYPKNEF